MFYPQSCLLNQRLTKSAIFPHDALKLIVMKYHCIGVLIGLSVHYVETDEKTKKGKQKCNSKDWGAPLRRIFWDVKDRDT